MENELQKSEIPASSAIRVGIYMRVSTTDQNSENQRPDLERYCEYRKWTVNPDLIYIDHGVSGRKSRRPGLDRLMEDVRDGRIDVVLVYKLDRLGRSAQHLLNVLSELKKHSVYFVASSQGLDTSTATGKLMFTTLSAFAEFESDVNSERTRAGLERVVSKGKKLGAPEKEVDMPTLRALRKKGYSARRISRTMNVPLSRIISRVNGLQAQ